MSAFDPKTQEKKIESKIIVSLERISEAFRVLLWDQSKKNSLSPIQIQMLIFILYHPREKCKVSYLAKEFNLTKATVSDSVKTLHKKELITKESDANDTRSYTIALTDKGKEVAKLSSGFTQPIEENIQNFSIAQKESMLEGLLLLISNLNQDNIVTIQRMCKSCLHYRFKNNGHYCNLLEVALQPTELRVDCPEHIDKTE